jgi:hypothetical protein
MKKSPYLGLLEKWQTRQALSKREYTESDIEIGRARERQLIAEAERFAEANRKPSLPAKPDEQEEKPSGKWVV